MTIRVLLAEDQAMVRGALAALLGLEGDIEVIAEVSRGDEVLPLALCLLPDIALLDIEMPGGDGLSVAATLNKQVPSCRVVILTIFARPGYLRRAMESHAAGYLLKDTPASQLAITIRRVVAGERVIDPDLAAMALTTGPNPLSKREREVLKVAASGVSTTEISRLVHLSEGTVRNYLSAAIQKLGTHTSLEAARLALEQGWL